MTALKENCTSFSPCSPSSVRTCLPPLLPLAPTWHSCDAHLLATRVQPFSKEGGVLLHDLHDSIRRTLSPSHSAPLLCGRVQLWGRMCWDAAMGRHWARRASSWCRLSEAESRVRVSTASADRSWSWPSWPSKSDRLSWMKLTFSVISPIIEHISFALVQQKFKKHWLLCTIWIFFWTDNYLCKVANTDNQ